MTKAETYYQANRVKCIEQQKEYQKTERGRQVHNKTRKKYQQTLKGCLHKCFNQIKQRCNNPNNPRYKDYGGRGIKCLFKSSDEFVDYVIDELQIDPRNLTIDRTDNDGHYEPGNIRFVTYAENNRNKRRKNDVN